jgi:bifunctional DNA-binding transcriptional regulator/antitoxin component of YhaV-PrlF toxin-antitoxin module
MTPVRVQMAQRGVIILPKALRDAYSLKSGDMFTLIDLGGLFVLSLERSRVNKISDELAEEWLQSGESLTYILRTLREVRQQ